MQRRAASLLLLALAATIVWVPGTSRFPAGQATAPPRAAGCSPMNVTGVAAVFCPARGADRKGAGVVVLHGCGGFGSLDYRLARDLPAAGIATLYVDYFGLTPPPGSKGFCDARGAVGDAFHTWEQIAIASAAALRREPGVTGVGVVGWSLGAGLALRAAADAPHTFKTLVLFSGGAADFVFGRIARLPPTLVLSGGSGDAVPVSDAIALHAALVRAHIPTELDVYPHGTHQWQGAQGVFGEQHAVAFIRRYASVRG